MTDQATVRVLNAADCERVVAIDKAITGRVRRGFYEKRFAAMASQPQAFVSLGGIVNGGLAGFLFAHILDGEFGGSAPVGVLDALGIDPAFRQRKLAQHLLAAAETTLAAHGVKELRTEADWTELDLVRFFANSGFQMAPRVMLERISNEPARF